MTNSSPATSQPVLRFAPSPNGALHLGHAYSALLNEDIARRLGGRLLLRIEDIDTLRCRPEHVAGLLEDLAWLGIAFEHPVRRQSEHFDDYRDAARRLEQQGLLYPCFASRKEIEAAAAEAGLGTDPDGAPLYPGLWRGADVSEVTRRMATGEPFALRLNMQPAVEAVATDHPSSAVASLPPCGGGLGWGGAPNEPVAVATPPPPWPSPLKGKGKTAVAGLAYRTFSLADLSVGTVAAHPERWGDAVVVRKETPTSYHLSVVVDDALQGVTHVVRGKDLEAATDLHRLLQALLGLPSPLYHHHRLIEDATGRKLAKSLGDMGLRELRARGVTAAEVRATLGFTPPADRR